MMIHLREKIVFNQVELYLLIVQSPKDGKRNENESDGQHSLDVVNKLFVEFVRCEIQPMIVFLAFGLPFATNGMLCIEFGKSGLIFKFTREGIQLSLN
jgi:hypothetical protein